MCARPFARCAFVVLAALAAARFAQQALAKDEPARALRLVQPSSGGPRWSGTTVDDVLAAKPGDEFWIWPHAVHAGTDARGWIERDVVAIRGAEFTDGLSRKSIRLSVVPVTARDDGALAPARSGEKVADRLLCVRLNDPVRDPTRWTLRDDEPCVGRSLAVHFLYRDRVTATLPPPFVRPVGGRVGTLPLGRAVWVSARILPDSGKFLIAKSEPWSEREFCDADGGAARVRLDRSGDLECDTSSMTKGLHVRGRQAPDGTGFDRSAHVAITSFVEDGARGTEPPRRLHRRPLFRGLWEISLDEWPDQHVAHVSSGDALMIPWEPGGPIRELTPWALAADEPFRDEFGDSYAMRIESRAIALGMYGSTVREPDPPWTLRLVPAHNAMYAAVFDRFRSRAGLYPPATEPAGGR